MPVKYGKLIQKLDPYAFALGKILVNQHLHHYPYIIFYIRTVFLVITTNMFAWFIYFASDNHAPILDHKTVLIFGNSFEYLYFLMLSINICVFLLVFLFLTIRAKTVIHDFSKDWYDILTKNKREYSYFYHRDMLLIKEPFYFFVFTFAGIIFTKLMAPKFLLKIPASYEISLFFFGSIITTYAASRILEMCLHLYLMIWPYMPENSDKI